MPIPYSWTNWNGSWRPWNGPSGPTRAWQGKADAYLLAALKALRLDRILRDPLAAKFWQGNTLGRERRHWFRAKFGGSSRFRLFFRANSRARVIVYAWVNDRDTLRKAGASSDPYGSVRGDRGNPVPYRDHLGW